MSNYLNIPKVLPFKFYPNTATPGIHFDDDWACNQIRSFEKRALYAQKWIRSYTTKLQITSTIEPQSLKLLDYKGFTVKSFVWTIVGTNGAGENVYECTYDVSTGVATDGYYYLYQKCELMSIVFEAISEPIWIKNTHRNVRPWVFRHSENAFGVIWTTGIKMTFMCESDIPASEYNFERDRNAYVDQVHNVSTLSAYPFNTAKLYIGEAPGVAPYIVDIANRILCCDTVHFADLQIETTENAKWEVNRQRGYPLIGASIEVTPAHNLTSLQLSDIDPITPGVVMVYNIDTNFFGDGTVVRMTEFEMT